MTASSQSVEPFDLVIFGGTGDLAVRKLLPALFHRFLDGQIPASSRIVGIAREALDDAGYRAQLREALIGVCAAGQLDVFLQQVFYRPLDARKDEGWDDFAAFIGSQPEHVRVFYLSTSPELFVDICTRLGQYKLNQGASRGVLADNGNMSSATLMFVLADMMDGPSIDHGVGLAFGPGLAAEGFAFQCA